MLRDDFLKPVGKLCGRMFAAEHDWYLACAGCGHEVCENCASEDGDGELCNDCYAKAQRETAQ